LLNPIATALADVVVGLDSSFERMSVVPLLSRDVKKSIGYITFEAALASGDLKVTEVSDAGHVPELKVINHGKTPVLLLDGEELVGAKQNRVVNLTILVPAMATVVIPVSCVEAGRWNRRSHRFSSSEMLNTPAPALCKVSRSVGRSPCACRSSSDQHWIWEDIAAKSSRMSAASTQPPCRRCSMCIADRWTSTEGVSASRSAKSGPSSH
jgi:hypothetical protein